MSVKEKICTFIRFTDIYIYIYIYIPYNFMIAQKKQSVKTDCQLRYNELEERKLLLWKIQHQVKVNSNDTLHL